MQKAMNSSPVNIEEDKVTMNGGPTEEQIQRMKQLNKSAAPFFIGGIIIAILYVIVVLMNWLDFSTFLKTSPEDLPDLQSRIGFVLRYGTFGALWVFICLFTVGVLRSQSPANDPTSGNDHFIMKAKNVLNNSFEQFILHIFSELILVQHLDALHTIRYIPALTIIFIVGRITFWLGYPHYRPFGFMLNIIPLSVTMAYSLYAFFI